MKKMMIFSLLVLALAGCSKDHYIQGPKGDKGDQGEVGPQGPQGVAGADGQDAILEIIDPCGDNPSKVDEVLLRLADGSLVGLFAKNHNGNYPRLAVITDGKYITTDGTYCAFTVDSEGQVSW